MRPYSPHAPIGTDPFTEDDLTDRLDTYSPTSARPPTREERLDAYLRSARYQRKQNRRIFPSPSRSRPFQSKSTAAATTLVTRPWGDLALGLSRGGQNNTGKGGLLGWAKNNGAGKKLLRQKRLLKWRSERDNEDVDAGVMIECAKDDWIDFNKREGRRQAWWNRFTSLFNKGAAPTPAIC